MGRNRKTNAQKRLEGNAGKRDLPPEHQVEIPTKRPHGLSREEKKYWKLWAFDLIEAGRLTNLTLPSFLTLLKMKTRLDRVNKFLEDENTSLLQETVSIDGSGQEHKTLKESAYAKMSRDLTVAVHRLEKSWGLTADSMGGIFIRKPKQSEEERFLGEE